MFSHWVEHVLERYQLGEEYSRQRVLLLWRGVVGEKIAKLSRALRLCGTTLWIEVSSPTVAQELSYLKDEYVRRLNERLGEETVNSIRFVPGLFPVQLEKTDVQISEDDRRQARVLFENLSEASLRDSFVELYLTLLRRERTLLASGGTRCSSCGVVFTGEGHRCAGCRLGGIADPKRKD